MIITLKKNTPNQEVDHLIQQFESQNLKVSLITGENYNVFGLVGDTAQLDERRILANEWVENVQRIAAPYKMTFGFPLAIMYSADMIHSSIVALKPRFNKIGFDILPTAFNRSKFCILRAPI